MWVNECSKVECKTPYDKLFMRQRIRMIQDKRKWNSFCSRWSRFVPSLNESAYDYFEFVKADRKLFTDNIDGDNWGVATEDLKSSHSVWSIFRKETRLIFHYKQPGVESCSQPGNCGFVLKTTPAGDPDGADMILCTDPSEYSNELHYHNEFKAEDMHLLVENLQSGQSIPLSWFGKPTMKYGKVCWDVVSKLKGRENCMFYVIFKLK